MNEQTLTEQDLGLQTTSQESSNDLSQWFVAEAPLDGSQTSSTEDPHTSEEQLNPEPEQDTQEEVIEPTRENIISTILGGTATVTDEEVSRALFVMERDFPTDEQFRTEVTNFTFLIQQENNPRDFVRKHGKWAQTLLILAGEFDASAETDAALVEMIQEIQNADQIQQRQTVTDSAELLAGVDVAVDAANVDAVIQDIEDHPDQALDSIEELVEKIVVRSGQVKDKPPIKINGQEQTQDGDNDKPFEMNFKELALVSLFIFLDLRKGGYQTTNLALQLAEMKFGISEKIGKKLGLSQEQVRDALGTSLEGGAQLVSILKRVPTEQVETYITNRNELELYNLLDAINDRERVSLVRGEVPQNWQMTRGLSPECLQYIQNTLSTQQKQKLKIS